VRWRELFRDLEGQLEAAESAELSAEVAERARREAALVRLPDRLAAQMGRELGVHVQGAGLLRGRVAGSGPDWLLLEEAPGQLLVPLAAVLGLTGIGGRTVDAGQAGAVAARLDLRWALRGLARDRTGVLLALLDGSQVAGTLDRVAADHLDLAEHGRGEARRASAVRQVRVVPLTALAVVRSG
jgi:hypothetical protein